MTTLSWLEDPGDCVWSIEGVIGVDLAPDAKQKIICFFVIRAYMDELQGTFGPLFDACGPKKFLRM